MTFSSIHQCACTISLTYSTVPVSQHDRYNNTRVPTRLCTHLFDNGTGVYTWEFMSGSMSRTVSPVLLHQLSSLLVRKKVRGRSGGLRHARSIPVLIPRQTFDDCSFYPEWHPRKSKLCNSSLPPVPVARQQVNTSSRQKLKCALLNARCVCNKSDGSAQFVSEKELDVCLVVDTR